MHSLFNSSKTCLLSLEFIDEAINAAQITTVQWSDHRQVEHLALVDWKHAIFHAQPAIGCNEKLNEAVKLATVTGEKRPHLRSTTSPAVRVWTTAKYLSQQLTTFHRRYHLQHLNSSNSTTAESRYHPPPQSLTQKPITLKTIVSNFIDMDMHTSA